MNHLERALQQLNLPREAAQSYIALLRRGKSSAHEVANALHIHRTVVYKHLEILAARGLVHIEKLRGRQYYSPTDPKRLNNLLSEQQTAILEAIPSLESLYNKQHAPTPQLRFYTDAAGLRLVMDEILDNPKKFYRTLGPFFIQELFSMLGKKYVKDWSKRRIAKRVAHEALRPLSMRATAHTLDPMATAHGPEALREYRFAAIPADAPSLIFLFDDKVAFINARPGAIYAAVLESKDIFETHSRMFDMLWATAELP